MEPDCGDGRKQHSWSYKLATSFNFLPILIIVKTRFALNNTRLNISLLWFDRERRPTWN